MLPTITVAPRLSAILALSGSFSIPLTCIPCAIASSVVRKPINPPIPVIRMVLFVRFINLDILCEEKRVFVLNLMNKYSRCHFLSIFWRE